METPNKPEAIILAAGRSTRMGQIDKLQLPLNGKAILLHAVDCTLEHVDRAAVVTPPAPLNEPLVELLDGYPVTIVENPNFEQGIASSIVAGVAAADENATGYLIMLGDMPDVSSLTMWMLLNMFSSNPDRIVYPVHDGTPGHPVVFPASLRDSLLTLEGDRGARTVVRQFARLIREVPVNDPGALLDVDRPEDYRRMVLG